MKKARNEEYVIGIDEVGRGALAGPVVVAAAIVAKGEALTANRTLGMLKDSKKLSAKQREAWHAHFKNCPGIIFAIARIYPRGIERMNISRAANLAAHRAYRRLMARQQDLKISSIFLDGGLYLLNRKSQGKRVPSAETIIKADEMIPAVAIASIIAKVHRDAYMRCLAKKYPEYSFEVHKGYGTKAHYVALQKYGSCPIHRRTFLHHPPRPGKEQFDFWDIEA